MQQTNIKQIYAGARNTLQNHNNIMRSKQTSLNRADSINKTTIRTTQVASVDPVHSLTSVGGFRDNSIGEVSR